MKAVFTRLAGAVAAAVPVYVHTGDWKAALLAFSGFAIYGATHIMTGSDDTKPAA